MMEEYMTIKLLVNNDWEVHIYVLLLNCFDNITKHGIIKCNSYELFPYYFYDTLVYNDKNYE